MVVHVIYDKTNPRGSAQVILQLVMLAISWLAVLARFVARGLIRSIGLDDWMIVPAQLFYTGFIVASLYFYQAVPGAQPANMEKAREGTTWIVVQQAMFPLCTLFWKLSLGLFFLRIVFLPKLKYMIYIVVIVSVVANVFGFFWCLFMCGNPRDLFDNSMANKCAPKSIQAVILYLYVSLNALIDIAFATFPFFLLHRSKLPRRIKNYAFGVLLFATITSAASVARIVYAGNILKTNASYAGLSDLNIVTVIELGTGIVASSLVTLRPLVNPGEALRKWRSSVFATRGSEFLDPERDVRKSDVSEFAGTTPELTRHLSGLNKTPIRTDPKSCSFG